MPPIQKDLVLHETNKIEYLLHIHPNLHTYNAKAYYIVFQKIQVGIQIYDYKDVLDLDQNKTSVASFPYVQGYHQVISFLLSHLILPLYKDLPPYYCPSFSFSVSL